MSLFPRVQYGNGQLTTDRSVAQQAVPATTRTQVIGTRVRVPTGGITAGGRYRARFNMTKTAAGVATSTVDISVGTTGTTADTARLSFTKPAGTAAIDEGMVDITAVFRTVSATGILVGEFELRHNGNTVGHAQVPVVTLYATSAAFDNTAEELYIATNLTTGAADAISIEVAEAEYRSSFQA